MLTFGCLIRGLVDMFANLYLVGKVILFPFFLLGLISLVVMGIVEFLVCDIWVLIIALFSRDMSVRDVISYMMIL